MDAGSSKKRQLSESVSANPRPKRANNDGDEEQSTGGLSDGAEKILHAEYSGMLEPPLIKHLKRILSEYPDNGQIIKELLQNAEDARASKMEIIYDERKIKQLVIQELLQNAEDARASKVEIIYDERKINQDYADTEWFTKFFKGPALCVMNDALFSEEDWKGIKMIASSVKDDNKLKVGRFGMGFKSVFHMTDFPCIISGDRILLIDPTGASNKINAEMKLEHLHRYRGMDVNAFHKAFEETVGIDKDVLKSGHYNGTVFWFPLRDESSTISTTIYDKEKTMNLFMSFAHDASETLLFLCHLSRVSLKIKSKTLSNPEEVVTAAIHGNAECVTCRGQRKDFIQSIEEREEGIDHDPLVCTFKMSLNVSRKEESVITEWLIMHYYMGNNSSHNLQELTRDPTLGFCPLVGIALPVNKAAVKEFKSRIFCFLPLPREGSMQTGLPVHVNAFFALNQNRHHIKWSTDDQKDQKITDRDVLWNQILIEECLTKAYKKLLMVVKDQANQDETPKESIGALYRLLPNEKEVIDKWKIIPEQLVPFVISEPIMYSYSSNTFVTIELAQFAMLTNLHPQVEDSKADIIETLETLDVPYVCADIDTFDKLRFYSEKDLNDLTPGRLAELLIDNKEVFGRYSNNRKYSILCYLLSNGNYSFLKELPMVKVSSGQWRTLGGPEVTYLCPDDKTPDLFPSFKNILVTKTPEMRAYVWDHFSQIASNKDMLELQWPDSTVYRKILIETLQQKVGTSYFIIKDKSTLQWLELIWGFLDKNASVVDTECIEKISLVPEIKLGNWEQPGEVILHPVSSYFLEKTEALSHEISDCFRFLGVTLLPDLPPWVPKQRLAGHIFLPNEGSVVALLGAISNSPEIGDIVRTFNTSTTPRSKAAFVKYLCEFRSFNIESIRLLKRLAMFHQVSLRAPEERYIAVVEDASFVVNTDIPIELPGAYMDACTTNRTFLETLGASETSTNELVEKILYKIHENTFYKPDECDLFMQYFLRTVSRYEKQSTLLSLASNIPFLKAESGERKRPKDLFNPDNELLKHLFIGDKSKFPTLTELQSDESKLGLKRLGLMDIEGLRAHHIVSTASMLDSWGDLSANREHFALKSTALLQILNKNTELLQQQYQSKEMIDILKELKFVLTNERPKHFPPSLPSFSRTLCKPLDAKVGNYRNECLIGATVPLVSCHLDNVGNMFGWSTPPTAEKVVEQLMLIKTHYTNHEKAYIMPLLNEVYNFLANVSLVPTSIQTQTLIWTGQHFEYPSNIVINVQMTDLETLEPYFFFIPSELGKYSYLFEKVGCHSHQSVLVLQQTLEKIGNKHQERQSDKEYEKDCQLTSNIIDKLAERISELTGNDVLLPIQTIHTNRISFLPASKCTADKNGVSYEKMEGDNSIMFVSDRISVDVAKILGAKPLNKQIFSGTESMGIEGFGQKEKLTDRLRKLIEEGYRDGVSIPKELIQNADDAGATVVKFLFDERDHDELKAFHLFSPEMAECQGSSIFVYNDASFSKSDFENITKLNGATKESDTSKIGRFGLGFCSVYNLTDIPSFVSQGSFVIFDPHETHLTKFVDADSPGIKIDFRRLENKKLLTICKNQFEPFQDIFGFKMADLPGSGYDGTLFRFPLRTFEQAKKSNISRQEYRRAEVQQLLNMFVKDAGNLLLFTQNVTRLELHHIPRDSNSSESQVLLFEATKIKKTPAETFTVLQSAEASLANKEPYKLIEQFSINIHIDDMSESMLPELKNMPKEYVTSWVVVWETGQKESLDLSEKLLVSEKGALPLSAVAVLSDSTFTKPIPMDNANTLFYDTGRFFCFLPLPIITNLEVHINGYFDVTSDRQRFAALTDDDKTSLKSTWNESLLRDAAVNALFTFLETFDSDCYHQLWPTHCQPVAVPFRESFFKRIIHENRRIFYGQETRVPFSDVVYLDPVLRDNADIGNEAFLMLLHIDNHSDKILVDIPRDIVKALKTYHDINNACIKETAFFEIFLQNIDHEYWNDARACIRNKIIIHALRFGNEIIWNIMKQIRCIPVQPNSVCKRPSEVVDEEGFISSLFTVEDEVFPLSDFKPIAVRERLKQLGMMSDIMPDAILDQRCSTIAAMANNRCTRCALERCRTLMQYIVSNSLIDKHRHIFENKYILPVLKKPNDWQFTWHADTDSSLLRSCLTSLECQHADEEQLALVLGKPSALFSERMHIIGGTVVSMVDENVFDDIHPSVWQIVGNKSLLTNQIIKHMHTLASEYDSNSEEMCLQLHNIFNHTYHALQPRLSIGDQNNDLINELNKMKNVPVILIGKCLYAPERVAFDIEEECPPHLNRLPVNEAGRYNALFKTMGVRESFEVEDIIYVLKEEKQIWTDSPCENVHKIIKLLQNLDKLKGINGDLSQYKDYIVAPDTYGRLYPMHELVIADDNFKTKMSMYIVDKSVPPSLAERLGAKHKQRKCYEGMRYGKPFGQKQKLVSRLRNLLNAYPRDSSILKELLQNADDAEATEMNIIKDYRYHATEGIFHESCEPLQGPALCVYNNTYFTDDDLQGIQDLGEGSKRNDPSKTGQYGVGFNAVYHLTDTPTFMTKGPGLPENGLLCIFDPTCKHLPGVEIGEPGEAYDVNKLRSNFPGVLLGYLEREHIFENGVGTLFRFPLRNKESDISQEGVHSPESVDAMCNEMSNDLFEALLFVKCVKQIRISNVTSGRMVEEYCVKAELSEEDSRNRSIFFNDIKEIAERFKHDKRQICNLEKREVFYRTKLSDNKGRTKTFFIQLRFGFDTPSDVSDSIVDAFDNGNLGCLPLGGVAFSTSLSFGNDSRAFCFLPLPGNTHLPVHINGHFALDHESRRGLWEGGYKQKWNECLMKNIIVPAYIECIHHWQKYISERLTSNKTPSINKLLEKYHSIFPIFMNVENGYWRLMIKYLYSFILNEKLPLFPVLLKRRNCEWVALGKYGETSLGYFRYFDNFKSGYSKHSKTNDEGNKQLELLLKRIGMKILQTPLTIKKSIEDSGTKTLVCTYPDDVLSFVAFYGKSHIDALISKTELKNKANLLFLLTYVVQSSNFMNELHNLPLLLTTDDVLRVFSNKRPIFISELAWMFPDSRDQFIHTALMNSACIKPLRDTMIMKGYMRELTLGVLITLIPMDIKERLHANGPTVSWDRRCPSAEWIVSLWKFIYVESQKERQIHDDSFRRNINQLSEWCILPILKSAESKLLQMDKVSIVVNIESFRINNNVLSQALENLSLPLLDESAFVQKQQANNQTLVDTYQEILGIITSYWYPERLLDCLYFIIENESPERIRRNLSGGEAVSILKYFSQSIERIRLHPKVKEKLRHLPLYLSMNECFVQLKSNVRVYLIPTNVPFNGLQCLMERLDIIVIRENPDLRDLFQFLSISDMGVTRVYADVILPNIHQIPQNEWICHIEYIKRYNLHFKENELFDQSKSKISNAIRNIAFIDTCVGYKKCSQLYSHEVKVFLDMCDENDFLPAEYRSYDWMKFISNFGLVTTVTDEMMIKFARLIETYPIYYAKHEKKAHTLQTLFTTRLHEWKDSTMRTMRSIRFILPAQLPHQYKDLFPQKDDGFKWICMMGSAEVSNQCLCWSTIPLLPFDIQENKYRVSLGIQTLQSNIEVIKHIQNISTEMQKKICSFENKDVSQLMEKVYTCLEEQSQGYNREMYFSRVKDMLHSFPFIHIPGEHKMVCVSDIVIRMSDEDQLKPFLFHAPSHYGKYFDLFEKLGVSAGLECYHCLNILFKLQIKVDKVKMLIEELRHVREALSRLNKIMNREPTKEHNWGQTKLFLPNQDSIMCESTDLVIYDNRRLKEKMTGIPMNYFIGFSELELKEIDPVKFVRTLPNQMRPKLLTDIVKEKFDKDKIRIVQDSVLAARLSLFIHSSEFIIGVCRILKTFIEKKGKAFDRNADFKAVKEAMLRINIKETLQLETILEYNGAIIQGTSESRSCFCEDSYVSNEGNKTDFYFKLSQNHANTMADVICCSSGLPRVIINSLENLPYKAEITVLALLRKYDDPGKVSTLLDDERFPSLEIDSNLNSMSAFPKPGTYVEGKFHPFLEQALDTLFDETEFMNVALELDDESLDSPLDGNAMEANPVYIYVHIIREIKPFCDTQSLVNTKYLIDTGGDQHDTVAAFRLYRFVRRQTTTNEISVYIGNKSESYLPFDENTKRIATLLTEAWLLPEQDRRRLIRRLLLQWHPDKNIGNEENATKIFDFIKTKIEELHRAEQARHTGYSRSSWRSRYFFKMFDDVNTRAKSYARAYRMNVSDYNMCHGTGNFNHRSACTAVVKDEHEAKRWMKQAKLDYQAATAFFEVAEEPKSYNWICYTCHQASEKALKAACYATNANVVSRHEHSLTWLARQLEQVTSTLHDHASELERVVGHHTRMRYPDATYRRDVPSDIFTKDDAVKVMQIAKKVIDESSEVI